MLPYALKIVWFSLSLSGLLSCWAVLSAFAVAIRSYWLALLYCIGCTILQGMFCLGLIWRMDPFLMPRSFCIAQTLLFGFSSFLLTGVSATLSMITSLAILKPGISASKTLVWHHSYTFTLVIFPILASVAQIAVVLKLDAVQPTDNLSCDASKPEWVRFLGYAGTPLVFSIPFSCLALMAVARMFRTQRRDIERSHNPDIDIMNSTNLTSLPPRRTRRKDTSDLLGPLPRINSASPASGPTPTPIPTPRALPSPSPSTAYAYPASPGRAPISPELSSPSARQLQFHKPFSPHGPEPEHADLVEQLGTSHSSTLEGHHSQYEPQDYADSESLSFVSSAFPTFAPPSESESPPNPRESPGHDFVGYLNGSNPTYYYPDDGYGHTQGLGQRQIHRYSPTTGWTSDGDGAYSAKWSQDETRNENHNDGFEYEYGAGYGKEGLGIGTGGDTAGIFEETRTNGAGVEDTANSNLQYNTRSLGKKFPSVGLVSSPLGSSRKRPLSTSPLANNSNPSSSIPPTVWRIIIFQLSFTLVLILSCISTLIDVITQRTRPSPFGTQHVALLLVAWGPVGIFGSIPSTRRNLVFWKSKPLVNL